MNRKLAVAALASILLIYRALVLEEPRFSSGDTENKCRIGAYYYPWFGINGHWLNDDIKGTPFLGYYNSSDPNVADEQIILAKKHWMDFFAVSWIGEGTWHKDDFATIDQNLRNGLLKAPQLRDFNFCLFYETILVKNNSFTEQKNFSDIFLNDLTYAANNYFNNPSYLRVNNNPVLFIYNVPYLYKDSTSQDVHQLLAEARRQLAALGVNLYIIGDMGGELSPTNLNPDWLYSLNATTNYFFSDPNKGWNSVLSDASTYYPQWLSRMNSAGLGFVPNVYPGFNNTNNENASPPWAVLPRDDAMIKRMLQTALSNSSSVPGYVMITSWNEWMEGTQIEPSMEEGELFLDTIYNLISSSQLKSQVIMPAIDYLAHNYNSTIGLVHESPDSIMWSNTYWLYSDNFLVLLAMAPYEPQNATLAETSRNISATMDYWLAPQPDLTNQYQVLNNSAVFPFNASTDFILGYSHDATIKSTVNNQTGTLDTKNYADIAFLGAIAYYNRGEKETAKKVYEEGLATWDGFGFKDKAFNGTYATCKNALYILASKILGLPYNSAAYANLLHCQLTNEPDAGGFATSYTDNGTPASGSNTETTALAILALSHTLPTPTSSPPWSLIAIGILGSIITAGIVTYYFLKHKSRSLRKLS